MKIRSKEIDDKEVYVDINDLLIELLIEINKYSTESEKRPLQALVVKLTDIRDKAHKK